jgi:hypothetical protein
MVIVISDTKKGTSYIDKNIHEYIVNNYTDKWSINTGGYLTLNHKNKKYRIHHLVFEVLEIL